MGGLAESIEKPGIGLMTPAISAESLAETIPQLYDRGLDTFVANIRKAKQTMTWDVFADKILLLKSKI